MKIKESAPQHAADLLSPQKSSLKEVRESTRSPFTVGREEVEDTFVHPNDFKILSEEQLKPFQTVDNE